MRVYLPSSIDDLRALAGDGSLETPRLALAWTAALSAELGDASDEEAEFALASAAADASRDTLAEGGAARGRRIVVVAEVTDSAYQQGDDAGVGLLTAALRIVQVDAILADAAEVDLASATDDLGWFATQEIGDLLA